jgi:hypothetical protein
MELKEYIDTIWKNDIDSFALQCKLSRTSIYNWMQGKGCPTRRSAKKIEEVTGGKVTFDKMWRHKR